MSGERYARAMSPAPLGDDATPRQRKAAAEKARADNEIRAEAARAERAAQLAGAITAWTALRDEIEYSAQQIKGSDPDTFDALAADKLSGALLAALDLHKPDTHHWVCCATCIDGGDREEWPCDTYDAIREAADG